MLRLFLVSFVFTLLLFLNQRNFHNSLEDNQLEHESESKEFPNDQYFFQRTYPLNTFATKAYKSALEEAATFSINREIDAISSTSWKLQGPGNIGARVNDIIVHPTNNQIVYLGYSSGGIFKTIDGGKNWVPIFDDNSYLSIGDLAFDPLHPDTIYVGTGDPNISSNPFVGNGLFRSTNGGNTWESIGLSNVGIISKIVVNPLNSNIIYVATMGSPFIRDSNRGLYKTIDGGKTWTNVLFLSNQAGIIDLAINPLDPNIIYAAGWDRIRTNYESTTYGPNCKILKSIDGGSNWVTLSTGLPTNSNTSRIGLAIHPTSPNIIYALYIDRNFNLGGVFRSKNSGSSWATIPTDEANALPSDLMGSPGFGWYFGKIVLNPIKPEQIYILGVETYYTENDGEYWINAAPNTIETSIHVDNHALVFDQFGNKYLGTDGGAYFCNDTTQNWIDFENIPATQFYKTAYNPFRPFNYYGGAQDNGSIGGNATQINSWEKLFDGDGFQTIFHPVDSNRYYVEVQNGGIFTTANGNDVNKVFSQKLSNGLDNSSKRGWFMPYIMSYHNPERLYCGTYIVYKLDYTKNSNPFFQTNNWISISPELTDKDTTIEDRFHHITALDESKQDSNWIIAGTSDANFWRTKDGGKNWTQSFGLPNRYITAVRISQTDKNRMFVSLSGYKDNSNLPHLFYSKNAGDQWINISGNLPSLAINDFEILPNTNDSSIVVATDGGVFITQNLGNNWKKLGIGMPIVPVFDLSYNEKNNEIVAGTFARSIYSFPIDSIEPLDLNVVDVGGSIQTDNGKLLKNTIVKIENFDSTNTNDSGIYNFASIPKSLKNLLFPYKDDSVFNGISTADMIAIRKHILQIEFLNSPYKQIAADANNDRKVSTADLVKINKIILRIDSTFQNNNVWRFVPSDYVFKNIGKPLQDTFPEYINLNDNNKSLNLNFIGIKVGDVNNSATINFAENLIDRNFSKLLIKDIRLEKDEVVRIPIQFDETNLNGFQLEFNFDQLELKSILSGSINIMPANYHYFNNHLIINWFEDIISNYTPLFYLELKSKKSNNLKNAIKFSDHFINSENYSNSITQNVYMDWEDYKESSEAVYPNPFVNQLFLPINPSSNQKYLIEIFNLEGQLINSKCYNSISITQVLNLSDQVANLSNGIYFISVNKNTIRKIIKQS